MRKMYVCTGMMALALLTACRAGTDRMDMPTTTNVATSFFAMPMTRTIKGSIHATWKGKPVSLRYMARKDGEGIAVSYYHEGKFLRQVHYGEKTRCLLEAEGDSGLAMTDWSWRLSPENGFYFLWLAQEDESRKIDDFFVHENGMKRDYVRRLFRDMSFSRRTEQGRLICDAGGRPVKWVVESGWNVRFEKKGVGLYDGTGREYYRVTVE